MALTRFVKCLGIGANKTYSSVHLANHQHYIPLDPASPTIPVHMPHWMDLLPNYQPIAVGKILPVKNRLNVQYISDVHVDINKLPKIIPYADILAVCGDVGNPKNKNFENFFRDVSEKFETVIFVPGYDDYNCGPLYMETKVNDHKPIILDIVNKFNNVVFLDNSKFSLKNGTIVLGSTLWTHPIVENTDNYNKHINHEITNHIKNHSRDIAWLKNNLKIHNDDDVLVLTHVPPTLKLIKPIHLTKGKFFTNWFFSDLEDIIKSPVVAWLSGHVHNVIEKKINGVVCGVNAYGYPKLYRNESSHIITKIVTV